jgi:ABC-type nitrate/sulfonate/bicarbonate transport system substrate-binding protein
MNRRNVWAEEGLSVEYTEFQSGSLSTAAMMAGELDWAMGAGEAVVNAILKGSDIRIVGMYQDRFEYHLIGAKDIRTIQDLRGRVVGLGRFGSSNDFATRELLRRHGLDPERDVSLLQIGNTPERVAALQAGGIQAALMSVQVLPVLTQEGYPSLLDMSKLDIRYPFGTIATTRSFVERHPEVGERLLRAIYRGMKLFREDREAAQAMFAEDAPELSREAVHMVWEAWRNTLTADLAPELPIFRSVLEALAQETPGAESATSEQLFDVRPVQRVNGSGFPQALLGAR